MVDMTRGFHAWANSSDYATGASDAGFTVVDGGSLPQAVDTDFNYYIKEFHFAPETVSDTFLFRIVTMDSDKVAQTKKSVIYNEQTGSAVDGTAPRDVTFDVPIEVVPGPNARFLGFEIDFGDTDALGGFQLSGFKTRR